jgi:pyridoxamine 5'-phosphate oxidase
MNTSVQSNDPLELFMEWYQEASIQELFPNAMTLATVDAHGRPSARVVLYKGISQSGFLFYTNYRSRKSSDLDINPHAALVFYWPKLYRQIRIEGRVERLTVEESAAYFQSRPYDSQIGAWASPQSQEIPNRSYLLDRYDHYKEKFKHDCTNPRFLGWLSIDSRLYRILDRP